MTPSPFVVFMEKNVQEARVWPTWCERVGNICDEACMSLLSSVHLLACFCDSDKGARKEPSVHICLLSPWAQVLLQFLGEHIRRIYHWPNWNQTSLKWRKTSAWGWTQRCDMASKMFFQLIQGIQFDKFKQWRREKYEKLLAVSDMTENQIIDS